MGQSGQSAGLGQQQSSRSSPFGFGQQGGGQQQRPLQMPPPQPFQAPNLGQPQAPARPNNFLLESLMPALQVLAQQRQQPPLPTGPQVLPQPAVVQQPVGPPVMQGPDQALPGRFDPYAPLPAATDNPFAGGFGGAPAMFDRQNIRYR